MKKVIKGYEDRYESALNRALMKEFELTLPQVFAYRADVMTTPESMSRYIIKFLQGWNTAIMEEASQ